MQQADVRVMSEAVLLLSLAHHAEASSAACPVIIQFAFEQAVSDTFQSNRPPLAHVCCVSAQAAAPEFVRAVIHEVTNTSCLPSLLLSVCLCTGT